MVRVISPVPKILFSWSLMYEDERYEGSHDVQWHTHSGYDFLNEVQEDDEGGTREITAVKTRDQRCGPVSGPYSRSQSACECSLISFGMLMLAGLTLAKGGRQCIRQTTKALAKSYVWMPENVHNVVFCV